MVFFLLNLVLIMEEKIEFRYSRFVSWKELSEKEKWGRSLQESLDELQGEEKKLAVMIEEERRRTEQLVRESEDKVIKSQKQIEESKQEAERRVREER